MVDVRRFMRYVIPGLIYDVLLAAAFFVSDPARMICFITSGDISKNIGFVLTALLASGALGYVFSNIYFGLYWLTDNSIVAINHKELFTSLSDKINIINAKGNPIDRNSLTKRDAWTIWSNYWFSNIENSKKYKVSSARVDNLVDITHSLGASLISTFLSLITWICLSASSLQSGKYKIIIIGWGIFLYLLSKNYYKSHKAVERMVNSILFHVISEATQPDTNGTRKKIDIYYVA